TLKHGYDRYVILDRGYQNNAQVVGFTPDIENTRSSGTLNGTVVGRNGNYSGSGNYNGTSTTYRIPGVPIYGGTHDENLMVKMFRANDPGASDAVDARKALGPNWRKVVKGGKYGTC